MLANASVGFRLLVMSIVPGIAIALFVAIATVELARVNDGFGRVYDDNVEPMVQLTRI